jgi:hypothetical protein
MSEESFRSRRERHHQQKEDEVVDTIPPPSQNLDESFQSTSRAMRTSNSMRRKIFITSGLIGLLLLIGTVGYILGSKSNTSSKSLVQERKNDVSHSSSKTSAVKQTNDPILAKVIQPTTGEKWYNDAKPLTSQGFVAASEVEKVDYYEVGTRGSNTIILGILYWPIQNSIELFERSKDGTVKHIARPNSQATYDPSLEYQAGTFVATVKEDTSTQYDSLSYPKTLRLSSGEVVSADVPQLGKYISSDYYKDVKVTSLNTFGQSKFIRTERKYVDTGLTTIQYVLQTPLNTEIQTTYSPIGDTLKNASFNNNVTTDDGIRAIVRGCGAGGGVSRLDTVSNDQFEVMGRTSDGKTLYSFKNNNASMVQKAYDEYKEFNTYDGAPELVSKEEFVKQHAIVAYKTKDGEWLIFTRDQYAPAAGCAKPVVYLYPTATQRVNVSVQAEVQKSDPLYPTNGWSVTAQPSGRLTYMGKSYDSLYWEGIGSGQYPAITKGTVVKRDKTLEVLNKQLEKQGLTATERSDFIAFWKDKIPQKPYIRLTWFDTNEMDKLAPLKITPEPDTVKRVFLDMTGFDKKITLPSQKLKGFERKGFTVVEWGGLSEGKLY